ncbi:MAG TPA: biotin carboxylase N-terminal domain-containing protein [Pseudolysinimonas sp.]|jgi:acetyl-CoA/propionyl-CoA carboxylase biotin carboxyl carrier protein
MFDTVLIANRGEIACRIIRTLRELGIRSVAVYSDADAGARHVRLADVAVRLGGAAAADSYLSIPKLIAAAQSTGAQAIHPGYGFVSENAAFAQACADAGLVFVGPSVHALTVMGDKISAKAQVVARGVPVVPGVAEPGLSNDRLAEAAAEVGFPVLIKPAAGGGGKGMHVARDAGEIRGALETARREAAASFGDDSLFLERLVQHPRHIEVQVLADVFGATISLGERECSLQRRHQKVIEETPSPLLDAATRGRIGRSAVDTARSVDYTGAGTVEFIVSADAPEEFFFMEMNTRLQVEHPVTESITGLDLVEWQLRIAAGEHLTVAQNDVVLRGHAIEARIYAEDPARGFLPTGGRILELVEPQGEGVRVDSALLPGLTVSSDYDPMLAKVIAWAPDRATALRRLQSALSGTVTLGVTTNVEFLRLLLAVPEVVEGALDTELIERVFDGLAFRAPDDRDHAAAALILAATDAAGTTRHEPGPWGDRGGWRLGTRSPSRFRLRAAEGVVPVSVLGHPSVAEVMVDDRAPVSADIELDAATARLHWGDQFVSYAYARTGDRIHLAHDGTAWCFDDLGFERRGVAAEGTDPELRSPMPGSVVAVFVADGDLVEKHQPVLSIEAMKMEHVMRASHRGTVSLRVHLGEQLAADQLVASIEEGTGS